MNKRSKRTLQRVQENDPTLTELHIGSKGLYEEVTVSNFSKLGNALGKNTKLSISTDGLKLKLDNYRNSGFSNGLKQNSSINELCLLSSSGIGRVGTEILKVYETNSNLTTLRINGKIWWYDYGGNGALIPIVANTLRVCTNLKIIEL